MTGGSGSKIQMFTTQDDEADTIANPVSGSLYDWVSGAVVANLAAATEKKNVRLLAVTTGTAWTVQPDPLEIHMLLDGITYKFSFTNPVTATYYDPYFNPATAEDSQPLVVSAAHSPYRPYFWEGRKCKIAFEITGGTVQALYNRVKWQRIV